MLENSNYIDIFLNEISTLACNTFIKEIIFRQQDVAKIAFKTTS